MKKVPHLFASLITAALVMTGCAAGDNNSQGNESFPDTASNGLPTHGNGDMSTEGDNGQSAMPSPTPGNSHGADSTSLDGMSREEDEPLASSADDELPAQRSGLAGQQTAPDNQAGGTCGTMSGEPVVAGPTTTCRFAMEVAMLATAGTHPEAYWPVTATSEATGKTYTMSCGIAGTADRVWCKDMNGTAEVTVGPGAPGRWNHLVD